MPWAGGLALPVAVNLFQHDGLEAPRARDFKHPVLNWLLFNNGYHAAHHAAPTLHWSRLPAEHARRVGEGTLAEVAEPFLGYVWRTLRATPMKLPKRMLYVSRPVDEVALREAVRPLVAGYAGCIPDAAHFRALAREQGLDLATMALCEAIRAAPENRRFLAELETLPVAPVEGRCDAVVAVVPALFHETHPEVGADGEIALEIARKLGFEAVRAPTATLTSLSGNAALLHEWLPRLGERPLCIVSLSKGSAEVRLLLERARGEPWLRRLKGWINVCGLVRGTPIHDEKTKGLWSIIRYRLVAAAVGIPFRDLAEYATDHAHWQRPLAIEPGTTVVSLVSIPLPCHIQTHLIGRYRMLSHLGPNDGMVACRDALLPGFAVPVWGADHFFRSTEVAPLLYRLFRWMRMRLDDAQG